ncbi:MAG: cytochrome ubiquinol oxidase subunit I, partial [Actinobacteria bacterium]|nr:cytochrome ubiquinol oxidase subunit I [Actinomycetota bacterium]
AEAMLLARRWSQVAAVLFAVGAVTGTVLSFEMGLLWPGLMRTYGSAYGIPFAVEGIFFFLEAIFIAIYIYGWKRLRPWPHFWTGLPVVIAGIGGTLSVVAANSGRNLRGGFTLRDGRVTSVRPLAVFFNRAFWYESIHMLLAAYIVAGFLTASVYAVAMRRGRRDRYHRLGFIVPFTVAAVVMPFEILVGDSIARTVFKHETAKFAAMELVTRTGSHVPETIGGILVDGKVRYGIHVPGLASLLAGYSTKTTITGLDAIPPADRAPASIVHLAFDVMVGTAFVLLGLALWFAIVWWRRRAVPEGPWFLRAASVAGLVSVVTLEAGWTVTEVGRQPWIVHGFLRTADAVTKAGDIWLLVGVTVVLYAAVGTAAVLVIRGMTRRWRRAQDETFDVPYGPDSGTTLEEAVPEIAPAP